MMTHDDMHYGIYIGRTKKGLWRCALVIVRFFNTVGREVVGSVGSSDWFATVNIFKADEYTQKLL
jgi:hypothetical protein